jgi:hypothetical protein
MGSPVTLAGPVANQLLTDKQTIKTVFMVGIQGEYV